MSGIFTLFKVIGFIAKNSTTRNVVIKTANSPTARNIVTKTVKYMIKK